MRSLRQSADGFAPRLRPAHERTMMSRPISLAAAVAFAFLVSLAGSSGAEELAPSIDPETLQRRVETGAAPVVLDVRTPAEFATGHIPGALNIPHTEIARRLGELDKEAEVALYCMVGPRARLGEQTLAEAGYKRILHIEGGLAAWKAAGLPVATPDQPAQ